tara:strand:+ start:171011 stop:171133 length:123 start_codon:yes stop_codon:yes gene_type:complete
VSELKILTAKVAKAIEESVNLIKKALECPLKEKVWEMLKK